MVSTRRRFLSCLKLLPNFSANNGLLAQNRGNFRREGGVKSTYKTVRQEWFENQYGVQVVGGSNPLAPTNYYHF